MAGDQDMKLGAEDHPPHPQSAEDRSTAMIGRAGSGRVGDVADGPIVGTHLRTNHGIEVTMIRHGRRAINEGRPHRATVDLTGHAVLALLE